MVAAETAPPPVIVTAPVPDWPTLSVPLPAHEDAPVPPPTAAVPLLPARTPRAASVLETDPPPVIVSRLSPAEEKPISRPLLVQTAMPIPPPTTTVPLL